MKGTRDSLAPLLRSASPCLDSSLVCSGFRFDISNTDYFFESQLMDVMPEYGLHKKNLQIQKKRRFTIQQPEKKSDYRTADKSLTIRLSTADFVIVFG